MNGAQVERSVISWVLGILLVLADLWAIRKTLRSTYAWRVKLAWCLVIAVLPFLGFLLWKIRGPQTEGLPSDEPPIV